MLKAKNSMANSNDVNAQVQPQQKHSNGKRLETIQEQPQQIHSNGYHGSIVPIQEQQQEQPRKNPNELSLVFQEQQQHQPSGVVVTTKWETFDSTPPLITFPSTSTSTSTTTPSMTNNNSGPPKFSWEFFE